MTMSAIEKLAIADLVLFSPLFLWSIFVCIKQGFNRSQGWLYTLLLSLIRIVGSALTISNAVHPNLSIFIAAGVLSSIGLIFLVNMLLGALTRINDGLSSNARIDPRIFRAIQILALAVLALTIAAGVYQSSYNDPDKVKTSASLRKASALLLLVELLFEIYAAVSYVTRRSSMLQEDHLILYAALASIPFIIVRLAYSIASAFASTSSPMFSYYNPNVWTQAFMIYLMEWIVLVIFLTVGTISKKAPKKQQEPKNAQGQYRQPAPGQTQQFYNKVPEYEMGRGNQAV